MVKRILMSLLVCLGICSTSAFSEEKEETVNSKYFAISGNMVEEYFTEKNLEVMDGYVESFIKDFKIDVASKIELKLMPSSEAYDELEGLPQEILDSLEEKYVLVLDMDGYYTISANPIENEGMAIYLASNYALSFLMDMYVVDADKTYSELIASIHDLYPIFFLRDIPLVSQLFSENDKYLEELSRDKSYFTLNQFQSPFSDEYEPSEEEMIEIIHNVQEVKLPLFMSMMDFVVSTYDSGKIFDWVIKGELEEVFNMKTDRFENAWYEFVLSKVQKNSQ